MALNLDIIGKPSKPVHVRWNSDDSLIYALGIGAGQEDPLQELSYTTENTAGVPQRMYPTYGVVLNQFREPADLDLGSYDPALLVHAEQSVELTAPLPVAGELEVTTTVTGIYDKGSGALVVTESEGRVPGSNEPLCVTRSSAFIRGEGGFGIKSPADPWVSPEGEADLLFTVPTRRDQALLYRLSGDRNPLHTDPAFAAKAGFDRPILHGMATYGIVARALMDRLGDSDPAGFKSMNARFSRPVFPGDDLDIRVWSGGHSHAFTVSNRHGHVVLDRGVLATQ